MSAAVLAGPVAVAVAVIVRGAARALRRDRARNRLVVAARRPAVGWRRGVAPPEWLATRLADAVVPVDGRVVATVWLAALILAPAAAIVVGGPGLAAALVIALVVGPRLALRMLDGRRAALVEAALPIALEGMARTLRTGGSLRHAVAEAAESIPPPLGDELHAVAAMVGRGAPISVALATWVERCPLPGVRLAAAALALAAETGGAQARAVDGVAATIRERLAAAAEVRAQATQARVSGVVIALAPVAFCALASATDPRTAAFLFRTPAGVVLLAAGLGLDALGAFWMNRLTRVAA
ncbi:MAG TPA: type II secretion system F family protein [Acidimicrobiales bacterium]|nr:type II secretion system F family protein [Acidimicrobiales bacterium]